MLPIFLTAAVALYGVVLAENPLESQLGSYVVMAPHEIVNPCVKKNPCLDNGLCVFTPYEETKFVCKCRDCFTGETCERNICAAKEEERKLPDAPTTGQIIGRIALTCAGYILLLLAVTSTVVHRRKVKKQGKAIRRHISNTSLAACSESLVSLASYCPQKRNEPNSSSSFCSEIYSVFTASSIPVESKSDEKWRDSLPMDPFIATPVPSSLQFPQVSASEQRLSNL